MPLNGSDMCRRCVGQESPQTRAERLQKAEIDRAIAEHGVPVDVDPRDAILKEIALTNGVVIFLTNVVHNMPHEDIVWGKSYTDKRVSKEGDGPQVAVVNEREVAGVNLWVQRWFAERKHLVEACKTAISLGLREREIELAKDQGDLMARIIEAILGDPALGLTAEAQGRVVEIASRHLTLVS